MTVGRPGGRARLLFALVAGAPALSACGSVPPAPDDGPTAVEMGVLLERSVSDTLGDLPATAKLQRVEDPVTDAVPCAGSPGRVTVSRTYAITDIPADIIPGSLFQVRDVLVANGWSVDRSGGTQAAPEIDLARDALVASYVAEPDAISVAVSGPCVPDDRDRLP